MPIHQVSTNPITNYLPAVLHKTKSNGWQIAFYALNPKTQKLERCRMKINRLKKRYASTKEANLHAQEILFSINQKLKGGWSPFFVGEDSRLYEKLSAVCEKFIAEGQKEKRKDTMRAYQSFVKMLNEWTVDNCKDTYCSMFSRILAVRYMDYMYNTRNVSIVSRL